jgi:hypothetical protein
MPRLTALQSIDTYVFLARVLDGHLLVFISIPICLSKDEEEEVKKERCIDSVKHDHS